MYHVATRRDIDDPTTIELFAKDQYPSARQCQPCHAAIFDEWQEAAGYLNRFSRDPAPPHIRPDRRSLPPQS